MFQKGEIWAYPTDTSFGLGVRADDFEMLEALRKLKQRPSDKFFSLMCRDFEMLKAFAEIPGQWQGKTFDTHFFFECPRTAILKPKKKLPVSPFWLKEKVAFRVSTIPAVAKHIIFPITAPGFALPQPPVRPAQAPGRAIPA